ncbi:hypothetical protein LPJ78_001765 [Coemansia sp. RSA 989]|nr:hypothetical protein LPJ68_001536 [Coemansia sp. RSA 1086]KAJ1751459.1 hypothetical protein LPJ79_002037 [Coemansia sp. RSA 1821]KAJ1866504.1 hypothetical protein LPJ78_001765 [Coemansia sp. RSA 989]KAJ1873848.1 hypothetical protein LPJ55_001982 [Coemansia sp. RSA 990]KAJ2625197.1 hypothetical protein H4R22_004997 [Coemansia sp. RSA 1290]KAJ2648342.1 hypothetical protein IWW40_003980 [Coemansia sp. RSA 1250]KAJ2670413.1 hypothetical protein IWW42_003982 [Coemansia sp. RSA 1085]
MDVIRPYTIVAHVDDSPEGRAAAEYACSLCLKLKVKYRLIFLYVVALYRRTSLSLINRQTDQMNADIREDAENSMIRCKQFLSRFESLVTYEWVSVKDEGSIGPIMVNFIADGLQSPVDVVVVGTSVNGGIKKIVGGDLSEYLLSNLLCPVMVVKNQYDISDDGN